MIHILKEIDTGMNTTKNMNRVDVNAIFAQVLSTDPVQEATGVHEKISFEREYRMFGNR